jgi:4-aminobutyrate aminotransferase and related aminotransferases
VLGRHVLADGFRLVYDTRASRGSWVVDARSGEKYLDLYTFFASAPLGSNPRGLADDPDFMAVLAEVAANKPANPDMYTTHYAQFVETFARVLGDPALPHLFFVEGGALAVENALKTAFDWKSRRNEAAGRPAGLGTKVLHLTRAFHGRSGYTLSLTNTDRARPTGSPSSTGPGSTCLRSGSRWRTTVTRSSGPRPGRWPRPGRRSSDPARHRLLHRRADPG